ncbi:alpha/beta-hydrolase [Clavulina sp. PMI_390]|nr:alpha/beta-hydrolase [Clavulina sp. PMI_390]
MKSSLINLSNGTALYVQEVGPSDAPVLILVHGLGGTQAIWAPMLEASDLKEIYHIISYDLRGAGLSPLGGTKNPNATADTQKLSIASHEEDLLLLFNHFSLSSPPPPHRPKPVLIAQSMGSYMAQQFVIDHPTLISKLVLINTSTSPFPPQANEVQATWIEVVRAHNSTVVLSDQLANFMVATPANNPFARPFQRMMLQTQPAQGYIANVGALLGVGEIKLNRGGFMGPVLVVGGEVDPVSTGEDLAEVLQTEGVEAKHVKLKGAGHTVPLEAPSELAATIKTWL